ncbi:MAG: ABC transporter ATP-binding protein/permease [Taibaiella sp.]|nr:ABC transporter ATP-binding protein/permease [Taibaiella sp.]
MKADFKNNFWGYFYYYKSIVGNHLFAYLFVNVIVGLLDGFGLAMFIPLLSAAAGDQNVAEGDLGNLAFLVDIIHAMGLELNLNSILLFLILLFCLKGLIRFFQIKYFTFIRYRFITKVRHSLMTGLQELSYPGFTKLEAGRIQNTLVGEVTKLFASMTQYFQSAQMVVMLLTYVILAFFANWQFAILIGIGAALSNFIYKRIFQITKRLSVNVSKKSHDFNAYLIQAISHFRYLKATNYFAKYIRKLNKVIRETEQINFRMGHYQAISSSTREPIIIAIIAGVIAFQINYLNGSLSSIIVSLLFFYRALSYLTSVQNFWQNFLQNVGSIEAVNSLYKEIREYKEQIGGTPYNITFSQLNTRALALSFDNFTVLEGVNVQINKNETTAFVGESGSGKTSLVNILAGLYHPTEGGVYLNNKEQISDINVLEYRSRIGYISQDPVIFNDTIFNNVTFWAEPNAQNRERFKEAIKLASLEHYIQHMPDRENTRLGDNGVALSGGQKQRISIARELFKDVDLLILDEATSALDSETEKEIQANIDQLKGKFTILVIAHRLSTIRNADKIYLLGNKTIEASGDFKQLINISPKFKRMVELQMINYD